MYPNEIVILHSTGQQDLTHDSFMQEMSFRWNFFFFLCINSFFLLIRNVNLEMNFNKLQLNKIILKVFVLMVLYCPPPLSCLPQCIHNWTLFSLKLTLFYISFLFYNNSYIIPIY